jgi:hypothetical protein
VLTAPSVEKAKRVIDKMGTSLVASSPKSRAHKMLSLVSCVMDCGNIAFPRHDHLRRPFTRLSAGRGGTLARRGSLLSNSAIRELTFLGCQSWSYVLSYSLFDTNASCRFLGQAGKGAGSQMPQCRFESVIMVGIRLKRTIYIE